MFSVIIAAIVIEKNFVGVFKWINSIIRIKKNSTLEILDC